MAAGDTLNVNHHMEVEAQWYGVDFMKTGGEFGRSLVVGTGEKVEDFYSWNQAVLSPISGEVVSAVDGLPDNPLGERDTGNPAGNHVVIATAPNRFLFIAHLCRGSVSVKVGQKVSIGSELGRCGNSGNSDGPHIHLHVQNTPVLKEGTGQNMLFKDINVELTGKVFEGVDWPLITGLFVWPFAKDCSGGN